MAYTRMKSFLEEQLQEIKDTGLFKEERIITTAQGADINILQGSAINGSGIIWKYHKWKWHNMEVP
jgi:hypothetical protein